MIRAVMEKWHKNKNKLREVLSQDEHLNECDYMYLLKKVVEIILNDEDLYGFTFSLENITQIDNGDYQGSLLFLIPRATYQPSETDYLITYVGYGSCSVCDTLQSIQGWREGVPTEEQLNDYMTLCLHLCEKMKKPYKSYYRDEFDIEGTYENGIWSEVLKDD